MARVEPPCSCFSTCNPMTTRDFLQSIPASITSQESPWYAYLRAVYGGDELPLPYHLSQLRYVHHNDAVWREKHPGVEWPMPPCTRLPNPLGGTPDGQWWAPMNWQARLGIKPIRTHKCERAACDRWLSGPGEVNPIQRQAARGELKLCANTRTPRARAAATSRQLVAPPASRRHIELFAGPDNETTRGTRWHYTTRRLHEFNPDPLLPNESWVEVMRTRAR